MNEHFVAKRVGLWVGLGAAVGLGVLLAGIERGRAATSQTSEGDPVAAQAHSLVNALEARLRSTESSLKMARQLLAELEGDRQPGPEPASAKEPGLGEDEGKLLEGVWRIAGIGGNRGPAFEKPPYDEYKIMSAGHYLWLSFKPETGDVLRSGGGVYTLKDGAYTARVECSNSEDLRAIVGQEYKGTCRVEGKKWYHVGTMSNGAVFDELWERVN